MGRATRAIDWSAIDLVVFDVDGTLYDQARLRRHMLIELVAQCCRSRDLSALLAIRAFRRCREELSRTADVGDFTTLQYRMAARSCGRQPDEMRALVRDWIEERPLRFLRRCRFDGVDEIFKACARCGKTVAVWSDYPAAAKLKALELTADIVMASQDDDVRRLKPDPAALRRILARGGIPAQRALLVGDRAEHDGEAARRAGVHALLKSRAAHEAFVTFRTYRDPVFQPLLAARDCAQKGRGQLQWAG